MNFSKVHEFQMTSFLKSARIFEKDANFTIVPYV